MYCALKLNQVRRTKKRVPTRVKVPLKAPPQLNDTWAMDFMGDTLYSARRYRIFNVLDEGNREALVIEVDLSLPSERVVTVLEQLVAIHGVPRRIRCDNDLHPLSRVDSNEEDTRSRDGGANAPSDTRHHHHHHPPARTSQVDFHDARVPCSP